MDGFKSRDGGCWRETVSVVFGRGWGRKAGRQRRWAWSHGDGPTAMTERKQRLKKNNTIWVVNNWSY
jgi:hypothetical protein